MASEINKRSPGVVVSVEVKEIVNRGGRDVGPGDLDVCRRDTFGGAGSVRGKVLNRAVGISVLPNLWAPLP